MRQGVKSLNIEVTMLTTNEELHNVEVLHIKIGLDYFIKERAYDWLLHHVKVSCKAA